MILPAGHPPGITPTAAAATKGDGALGKDDFVRLLLSQMSHQDPTSPMDSHAFVAQLAQFANVELLQSTNSRLEALLVAQTAAHQTGLSTLVGREVSWRSDAVTLEDGAAQLSGRLSGAASEVTAVVVDASGKEVRRLQLGAQPLGPLAFTWDGRDDQGARLPDGPYTVRLTAQAQDGSAVAVEAVGRARVSAVAFDKGYAELIANGLRIMLGEVVEIRDPTLP